MYILTRSLSNLSFLKSCSPVPVSTTTAAPVQLGFLQEGEGKGGFCNSSQWNQTRNNRVIKELSSGNPERSLTPIKEGRCVLLLILHRCHLEEEKGWNHDSWFCYQSRIPALEASPESHPIPLHLPHTARTPPRPFPRLLSRFINHVP